MNKVLIIVDCQNDFIYGSLGTPEAHDIVNNVTHKIDDARAYGDLVIFTIDKHYGAEAYEACLESKYVPPHCMEDTEGVKIIPELEPFAHYTAHKSTYGYQGWDNWADHFCCAEVIELCGVCTDICVISNALILRSMYPNTPIRIDASCCAGLTPEKHRAALEVMKSCNIEVINE